MGFIFSKIFLHGFLHASLNVVLAGETPAVLPVTFFPCRTPPFFLGSLYLNKAGKTLPTKT